MNIFRKLFGKSNGKNKNQSNEIDIEKLLDSEDTNGSIIEIDNYICKICVWGEKMENLTEAQKNFYYNQNLEREVNNGGFNQYFLNSSGDYTTETVNSLKLIGANKTAKILEDAIRQFPKNTVPKDRNLREQVVEEIEDIANEVWEELEEKFMDYEDDLNVLNLEFVKKNKKDF